MSKIRLKGAGTGGYGHKMVEKASQKVGGLAQKTGLRKAVAERGRVVGWRAHQRLVEGVVRGNGHQNHVKRLQIEGRFNVTIRG